MSSEEDVYTKQNGKNYVIDLNAFSRTKMKLETELRNKPTVIKLLKTYCSGAKPFSEKKPLLSPNGAFHYSNFHIKRDPKPTLIQNLTKGLEESSYTQDLATWKYSPKRRKSRGGYLIFVNGNLVSFGTGVFVPI